MRREVEAMLFAAALMVGAGSARAEGDIAGVWVGQAAIPGQDLALRFDVTRDDAGISVVMDIPESKLIRFTAPAASFDGERLRVEVPPDWGLAMFRDIGLKPEEQIIRFVGTLRDDAIVGEVTIAYATFPLTMLRPEAGAAAGRVRREEVRFRNADVSLAGTLYRPPGPGPFGVLVFTHGSGDSLREAYAREAEALASAGVAALVYDKRGAGKSTGANWRVASFDELASDARAAVDYLAARPDIDAPQIGLFGLSQGTWLIGMVAKDRPSVGFLVFASGSGISVWEQEIYRTEAMMRAYGFDDAAIREAQEYQRMKFEVARTGLGWPELEAATKRLGATARWFDDFANDYASLTSARFWWLAAFHHDPAPILEHLRMPVLVLLGEKDLSFPVQRVKAQMERALARAENRDVTIRVFAGAEHQLMVPQMWGGRSLRRCVAPDYLPILTQWVRERATRARQTD